MMIDVPSSQSATEGERASKMLSNQHSEVGRDLSRLRPGVGGSEKGRRSEDGGVRRFPGSWPPGPGRASRLRWSTCAGPREVSREGRSFIG